MLNTRHFCIHIPPISFFFSFFVEKLQNTVGTQNGHSFIMKIHKKKLHWEEGVG